MNIRKLHFDNHNKTYDTSEEEVLRQFITEKKDSLQIELIEIRGVDTPSEITIIIKSSSGKMEIPLYKLRSEFICQNNIFALDTQNNRDFLIDTSNPTFSISVDTENENFSMTIFYSTIDLAQGIPISSGGRR